MTVHNEWTICEDSGQPAVEGVCPCHHGDACLVVVVRKGTAERWRVARHLEPTPEGPYIVDCSQHDCDDPTHFGGSITDSARRLDRARTSGLRHPKDSTGNCSECGNAPHDGAC